MTLTRRTLGGALGLAALGQLVLPREAHATTAVALALDDLLRASYRVALVTPTRSSAAWETTDGQRRIVTRTSVLLQDVWRAKDEPQSTSEEDAQEMVMRTLGGRVGEIQQRVHGEAALRSDEPVLVFAGRLFEGGRRIVGMAQGQYPLVQRDGQSRLGRSRDLPELVRRPSIEAAIDLLPRLELSAARRAVEGAR
jgi:hypothetical protein